MIEIKNINEQGTNVRPLHDWILVKKYKEPEISKGGIVLPTSVKKDGPQKGVVIAAGPGRYDNGVLLPMSTKPGDTVLIGKYSQETFEVEGQEIFMMKDSDTYGVIE